MSPIIQEVSQAQLPGVDINDRGTIYYIGTDGLRYAYPSLAVYNSWNIKDDFSDVIPANAADLKLGIGVRLLLGSSRKIRRLNVLGF